MRTIIQHHARQRLSSNFKQVWKIASEGRGPISDRKEKHIPRQTEHPLNDDHW